MEEPFLRDECPYRTPTRAVDVEIAIQGAREVVTLYVATLSQTHAGPETLDEALNRERDFLPVRSRESGQTFLVRRKAIRTLTVGDGSPDILLHQEAPSCVDLVRLELAGGETIEGTLATVLPPERQRLSDYFNDTDATFVPLAVEKGVTFVNRDFIVVVRL